MVTEEKRSQRSKKTGEVSREREDGEEDDKEESCSSVAMARMRREDGLCAENILREGEGEESVVGARDLLSLSQISSGERRSIILAKRFTAGREIWTADRCKRV
jgi:hypothetical protein